MIETILNQARQQKKNILILSTPRSGTNALGYEFVHTGRKIRNLGEICIQEDLRHSLGEIKKLYNTKHLTVAQLVRWEPKLYLSSDLTTIKDHAVIVCLRRKNKIKQFASFFYFNQVHRGLWANTDPTNFHGEIGRYLATKEDIDLFIQHQMMDDFFHPDFNLVYENLVFTQPWLSKNSFPFPLEQIFSNLDYLRQRLENWAYSQYHLT